MLVRRADLHHRHIQRHDAGAEQVGNLTEKYGHITGHAVGHGGAGIGADEEGIEVKHPVVAGIQVGRRALGVDAHQFHPTQFAAAGGHGIDQQLGGGRGAVQEHPLAGLDIAHRLLGGNIVQLAHACITSGWVGRYSISPVRRPGLRPT